MAVYGRMEASGNRSRVRLKFIGAPSSSSSGLSRRGEGADVEGEYFVMNLMSRCIGRDILEDCGYSVVADSEETYMG